MTEQTRIKAYIDVDGHTRRLLIAPKLIEITRAEGPSKLCDKLQTATSYIEANTILRQNSNTAPKGGAYDKHDFKVTFEDGETYNGRYDLQHHSERDPRLEDHMREWVRYLTGVAPAWMRARGKEQALAAFRRDMEDKPEQVAAAKLWMETYDIGQSPPFLDDADPDTLDIVQDFRAPAVQPTHSKD